MRRTSSRRALRHRTRRRRLRVAAAALMLMACGGLATVVFAPGTPQRATSQPQRSPLAGMPAFSVTRMPMQSVVRTSPKTVPRLNVVEHGTDMPVVQTDEGPSPFINSGGRFEPGVELEPPTVSMLGDDALLRAVRLPFASQRKAGRPATHSTRSSAFTTARAARAGRSLARRQSPGAPGSGPRTAGLTTMTVAAAAIPAPAPLSAAPRSTMAPSTPLSSPLSLPPSPTQKPPARLAASSSSPSLPVAEPSAVIVDNTLKGYGPIDEPLVVVSGGTLSPGASPGIMVLDDFTLEGGTLEIEIWGPDAGDERDVLQVQGTATFDSGTIEFVFTDATGNVYVPAVGDTFEFLTATTALTGFDDNDQLTLVSIGLDAALDFGVTRTGTALILEISAAELAATRTVPAPGSFVLLLAGLTLLLAARRKYRFPAA